MNYTDLCQIDINIDRIKAVLDLTYAPGWSHTISSRNNPGLYYIVSGSMDICINSISYQLNSGTIVAFSDNDNVKMYNNSDEDLSTIQFTFYSAEKFLFNQYDISHVSQDNNEKYLKYFKQALRLFTQKPIAYKLGIRSILEQIIRRLIMDSFLESVNQQSSKSQKLVILQKYLDENYANLPIERLNIADKDNMRKLLLCADKFKLNYDDLGTPFFCMGDHYIIGWADEDIKEFEQYLPEMKN